MLATKNETKWKTIKQSIFEENCREYFRAWFLPRLDSPNTQIRKINEASTNQIVARSKLGVREHGQTNPEVRPNSFIER